MARSSTQIVNQLITGTGADAAARPSVAFGDTDTGFYEAIDDKLTVTLAGVDKFHFSGSAFTQADGTPYITTAVLSANSVGNTELSGQIRWNKLANDTQGRLLYVDSASQVSGLATSTSGLFLMTQGASANPVWTSVPATASGMRIRGTFQGSTTDTVAITLGKVTVAANDIQANGQIFIEVLNSDLGAGQRGQWIVSYDQGGTSGSVTVNRVTIDTQDNMEFCRIGQDPADTTNIWMQGWQNGTNTVVSTGAVNTAAGITAAGNVYVKHLANSGGTKRTTFNVYY